jgi:hypothetical protein
MTCHNDGYHLNALYKYAEHTDDECNNDHVDHETVCCPKEKFCIIECHMFEFCADRNSTDLNLIFKLAIELQGIQYTFQCNLSLHEKVYINTRFRD